MKILYEMIHDRAGKTWSEPITMKTFPRWSDHWIACARSLRKDFESGGLFDTAAELDRIIAEQTKISCDCRRFGTL